MKKIYTVWSPDIGSNAEDGRAIQGSSPADAAQRWAQREDCESSDYWIVGGDGAIVHVLDGSTEHRFHVRGEQTVDYWARELGPEAR